MLNKKQIDLLYQEVAKDEHVFRTTLLELNGNEWFEVVRRDLAASLIRRQDELRSQTYYMNQVIQEREVRNMSHLQCYAELQDEWISEDELDSVAFEVKYSRYTLEEIQDELIKKRSGK